MATVLPLKTAWIADILSQASLLRRDVQRQLCWKRSGDGQRLWDYGTTVRSFNAVSALCVAVERRGSTLTWTVCKAIGGGAPGAKSGKFVRRAYSRTALDCEKTAVLCLLPSWSTLLFDRGLGKRERFDVAARSEPPKPSCQSHKEWQLRPRRGPSKGAHTRTKDKKRTQRVLRLN